MKNLRHEMRNTIMNNMREGANKHAIKAENRDAVGVWSYGTRNDLLDKANVFAEYCRNNGINRANNVDSDVVRGFLETKAQTCTDRTVDAYRSAIGRIGDMMGHDWHADKVTGHASGSAFRGSGDVMSRADLDRICAYAAENPSASGICVRLERELGVRVADMAYGVRIESDTLCINSKNGRVCERTITPAVRELLREANDRGMVIADKLKCPKDDSLNKYLHRTEEKLGMEYHSWHSIRRTIAQERYDEYRSNGMDREAALGAVGLWLNHGEHRESMVLESYINNAW